MATPTPDPGMVLPTDREADHLAAHQQAINDHQALVRSQVEARRGPNVPADPGLES